MYHLMYCIMYHQKTHVIKCLEKKHAAALVIHYIIQHGDDDLWKESGNVQKMKHLYQDFICSKIHFVCNMLQLN